MPLHNDRRLFEFLILEGAQAGLSWITILKKRQNYRKAFDYFDPHKIAGYDTRKISELLSNEGIVRNKLKINAAIQNATSFLAVQKEFGSFNNFIWQFVGGDTIKNKWKSLAENLLKHRNQRRWVRLLKNEDLNLSDQPYVMRSCRLQVW